MKALFLVVLTGYCIISCKPVSISVDKKSFIIQDSYKNDTLYLQDVILCGTLSNLRYPNLYKNIPIPYAFEDVVDLVAQNIIDQAPLVFETVDNKINYFLCSSWLSTSSNNIRTLQELKFLFPQKDDKTRVIPHINFIKEIDVRHIKENIKVGQSVDLKLSIIKNGEILYFKNLYLWTQYQVFESVELNNYPFPFVDLEKINVMIEEALKDYFKRVEG